MPKKEETIELILKKLQLKQENCIKLQDEIIALEEEKAIKKEKLQEIQTLLMQGENAKEKKELLIKTLDFAQKNKTLKEENKDKLDHILNKLDYMNTPQKTFKKITFEDLQEPFLAHQVKIGKVGPSSLGSYQTAFKDLIFYFKDKDINSLEYQNFEEFQDFLIGKRLENNTINNKITYTKMFLRYALKYKIIEKNYVDGLERLKERKSDKDNFTNEEILLLLNHNYKNIAYNNFFKIAAFTGMRLGEILALTPKSILEKDNIKYYNIEDSKTPNGIREVPIHQELLNIKLPLFKPQFKKQKKSYVGPPIMQNFTEFVTARGKAINKKIDLLVPSSAKTCHRIRGTFINRALNNFPEKILVVQEVVGHSKGAQSITVDTYAKGFDIKLKKEIVDSIKYSQN